MKAAMVIWEDAVSQDEWQDLKEAIKLEPAKIISIGFVLKEDEKSMLLALNFHPEEERVSQTISVLKSTVLQVIYFPEWLQEPHLAI